jgi:hypothetical protein
MPFVRAMCTANLQGVAQNTTYQDTLVVHSCSRCLAGINGIEDASYTREEHCRSRVRFSVNERRSNSVTNRDTEPRDTVSRIEQKCERSTPISVNGAVIERCDDANNDKTQRWTWHERRKTRTREINSFQWQLC